MQWQAALSEVAIFSTWNILMAQFTSRKGREGVEVEINYVQTATAQGLWFPNKARALHKRWKQHWPALFLNEKGESSAECSRVQNILRKKRVNLDIKSA